MIFVDRQGALDRALDQLAAQQVIALDTEADSLHSYFDKTCLVQFSTPDEDFVIDPLAKLDLSRLGEILANPSINKILHGADYDVRILQRDFGYLITNLTDTMICAQLLGYDAFGLAALLEKHFNVKLDKVHQRADWAMRPLPPDMLGYAAMDTHYLIPLAALLREDLEKRGRWEWAREEFARLEAVRFRETDSEAEVWRKLKNIGALDRRSLAVLRDLHNWRDGLARAADRPPFKIIGNDALVDIAREKPRTKEELSALKSVSRPHAAKHGATIVRIVLAALEAPESTLPERGESKAWIRDRALEGRIDRLKRVRDIVARDLALDPGILAPRHVLTAVATIEPQGLADFNAVPAMREWQKGLLGEAFLAVTRKDKQLSL